MMKITEPGSLMILGSNSASTKEVFKKIRIEAHQFILGYCFGLASVVWISRASVLWISMWLVGVVWISNPMWLAISRAYASFA
jgi:hypothetical protein